ncbi:hypothetical protein [Streptomyces sp. NPDC000229]
MSRTSALSPVAGVVIIMVEALTTVDAHSAVTAVPTVPTKAGQCAQ